MSRLAAQVIADRLTRDAARAQFDDHYGSFKADVQARGIGGRIADEAIDQARVIFDEAASVVEEHPTAVGGTLAAIALWFARDPIMVWIDKLRK